MDKGLCRAIASTMTSPAARKLQRMFIDFGGTREVALIEANDYLTIVLDHLTRFTLLLFLKHKPHTAEEFEESLLASLRGHGVVEIVHLDDGHAFA